MAMVCTQVTEWIQQEVSKPIEDWEESTEKKCKKRKWYDPRGWLCWFVRVLVLVIRWVVVTVVTAVITIVCHLVADLLSILWNVLKFFGNLFKALFTWDKCALQSAIGNIADAFVGAVELPGDVLFRPITDRIQTYRLRNYVGEEIDKRFADQPDLVETIKNNLNVNTGVFSYRLTVTLHRMFVDSETRTPQSGDVPNLIFLHESGLNLYELAGFDHSCDIWSKDGWRRSLPRTAKKTFAGGGGDVIDTDPPEITRDDLKEYNDSRGAKGPPFLILAMSTAMQDNRIKAAQTKGRQLGLILSFDPKLKEVTDPKFINYNEFAIVLEPICCATKPKAQVDYLICELGRRPDKDFVCCDAAFQRTDVSASPDEALHDLCKPVAVGVFRYPNKRRSGYTSNLIATTGYDHDLSKSMTSGVSFRAQIPEEVRQWVLIHELGHYFGLTHVDGFDRIMVSGEEGQGDLWSWDSIPNIFLHGGPRFIYTEAKRVWNFILTNFPTECLAPRTGTDTGVIL
jgi:hypothetical protein